MNHDTPQMYAWTWPFETEGETLTSRIGPDKNGFRQKNEWDGVKLVPRYPVYVISKGRWDICKTSQRVLERMQIPHTVVVEPQELSKYQDAFASNGSRFAKFAVLPFSNLGQGSIPARNWVWSDAIKRGTKRHWILDDNLHCFQRLHRGEKQNLWTGAGFCAMEDFVDQFSNVALAGPQYISFAPAKETKVPYRLNTRIYSCTLVLNDLPLYEHWRGRYNEDTDLSLRVLKAGFCTVLSNAFLVDKTTTMRTKGGNTTELYGGDGKASEKGDSDTLGRQLMAESLKEQHPDVTEVVRRFGRWHHKVNYRGFKTALNPSGPPALVKEYGLVQKWDDGLGEASPSQGRLSQGCSDWASAKQGTPGEFHL